jgi:hypothetical protein
MGNQTSILGPEGHYLEEIVFFQMKILVGYRKAPQPQVA